MKSIKEMLFMILALFTSYIFAQDRHIYPTVIVPADGNRIPSVDSIGIERNPWVDTEYPCYVTNMDFKGFVVFDGIDVEPIPGLHQKVYLKKLSDTLGLHEKRPMEVGISDSLSVEFIVTKNRLLTDLKPVSPKKPEHELIIRAIKQNACDWLPALSSGRPVHFRRRMTFHYTVDNQRNILSLDSFNFYYKPSKSP